jgi:hypothetical protein
VNFPRVNQDDGDGAAYRDFDRRFIYTTNLGSCTFRETMQSANRVRYFKNSTTTLGLAIHDVYNPHRYPVTKWHVAEELHALKSLTNSAYGISVREVEDLDWVFTTLVDNRTEFNVNVRFPNEVVNRFLELENICPVLGDVAQEELMVNEGALKVARDDWKFDEIADIDPDECQEEVCPPLETRKRIAKHNFVRRSAEDAGAEWLRVVFDHWFMQDNRQFVKLIYLFKRTVYRDHRHNGQLDLVFDQQQNVIEFYKQPRLTFPHLLYILKGLGVIVRGEIDMSKSFTTLNFRRLLTNPDENVKDYKDYTRDEINALIRGSSEHYEGRTNAFNSNTLRSVTGMLTRSFFNYTIETIGRVTENGHRVTAYKFVPGKRVDENRPCLFSILKDQWDDVPQDFRMVRKKTID